MIFKIEISSRKDFSKVYELFNYTLPSNSTVILDFKGINFFEPLDIILFSMCVIELKNKNLLVKYVHPQKKLVDYYLTQIGLVEFCKTNYSQPATITTIQSKTAMPLRRITISTMNEYIELAKGYFSHLCDSKDLDFLNLTISELINNVNDHSLSKIDAYIFSQFYPKLNTIKVVVGDLGIGIPNSVNEYRRKLKQSILTDKEAILWAIDKNTSTKSRPHNRGKGFDNLIEFTNYNKSIMYIYSNSAILAVSQKRKALFDNTIANFKGTLIQMEIYVDNLPPIANIEE
ncbi:MAG: hypothetical protein A2237_06235, partial [Stygiobacter sp. RIFOXYA2_FULL_38_8]